MLAADANEQMKYIQESGVHVDELALEFDDALYLVNAMRTEGTWNNAVFDAIQSLDDRLDSLSGPRNSALWTCEALRDATEWVEVRRLATNCLNLLQAHTTR